MTKHVSLNGSAGSKVESTEPKPPVNSYGVYEVVADGNYKLLSGSLPSTLECEKEIRTNPEKFKISETPKKLAILSLRKTVTVKADIVRKITLG